MHRSFIHFKLICKVCTASPITIEDDVTKLFSPSELLLAKDAGLQNCSLLHGHSLGLTFDEMMNLNPLRNSPEIMKFNFNFNFMVWITTWISVEYRRLFFLFLKTKICKVLVPEHKTSTNYSTVQETHLNELLVSMGQHVPSIDQVLFIVIIFMNLHKEHFVSIHFNFSEARFVHTLVNRLCMKWRQTRLEYN